MRVSRAPAWRRAAPASSRWSRSSPRTRASRSRASCTDSMMRPSAELIASSEACAAAASESPPEDSTTSTSVGGSST